jgi:hypothetical protein
LAHLLLNGLHVTAEDDVKQRLQAIALVAATRLQQTWTVHAQTLVKLP